MPGHFALILHAHLPFVRHPEHEDFLEEEWLFEAITETYIPLLRVMQRLADDHVPFKLTMSITPTLCAMLQDQLLCERYIRHLDLLIDLAARERMRNRKHPQLCELAEFYIDLFSETRRHFVDEWKCDLLPVFRELRQTGALEIIASAATHGLLPILQQQSPRAARCRFDRARRMSNFGGEPPDSGYPMRLRSSPGRFWRISAGSFRRTVCSGTRVPRHYAPLTAPSGLRTRSRRQV
jgi:1,4-alpha-glucan branching enzyme